MSLFVSLEASFSSVMYINWAVKNYVTATGGRGSTILLHFVTYMLKGEGVLYDIVT